MHLCYGVTLNPYYTNAARCVYLHTALFAGHPTPETISGTALSMAFNYFMQQFSCIYNRSLYLRQDTVTEGNCLREVTQNAQKTLEDYFIAPPGYCSYMHNQTPFWR